MKCYLYRKVFNYRKLLLSYRRCKSSACVDDVPALSTHRPMQLPCFSEDRGLLAWRTTLKRFALGNQCMRYLTRRSGVANAAPGV